MAYSRCLIETGFAARGLHGVEIQDLLRMLFHVSRNWWAHQESVSGTSMREVVKVSE